MRKTSRELLPVVGYVLQVEPGGDLQSNNVLGCQERDVVQEHVGVEAADWPSA